MNYYYRRDDNGKLEKVGFPIAIQQDAMGFITLAGGVKARRVHSMDPKPKAKKRDTSADAVKDRPILSDTLGVTISQLPEMEAARKLCGFGSVEFVPDPDVKGFFKAKFGSAREKQRYAEHRGMPHDKNGMTGTFSKLSEEDMEKARALVSR